VAGCDASISVSISKSLTSKALDTRTGQSHRQFVGKSPEYGIIGSRNGGHWIFEAISEGSAASVGLFDVEICAESRRLLR
jgi:hypothetical protein